MAKAKAQGKKKKEFFMNTPMGKTILKYSYGWGAAVVIVGALFKINHWKGGTVVITIGLVTEAIIFFLSVWEQEPVAYHWENVYPELMVDKAAAEASDKGVSAIDEFDKMLEKAQIEQELLNRLGTNLAKLGDNVESMSSIADAAKVTEEYSENARQASAALVDMKGAYSNATSAMSALSEASNDTKEYHEQVQQVSKNLSALNSMYELELQDTSNHIKAMNKFYGNLVDAMSSLEEAKDDAVTYKDQMSTLSKNLTSLNNVYGNMLNAMKS